ncbi:SipW-dependent-type signal peptide-containing protein [Haladaptatus cibarius]|uniref:SipW-dependent-type signal peptide-containing protein n=1 Tax=Haladaptatus cibarius TaxID=453847 RepID=UPI000679D078|nr:SipW-dependent-type signal peptide-containing protein [Haladaptatus cibarius]
MSDKTYNLTRRKALLGLGGIGAGAALGGAGTMAWLNDPESIEENMITAGELDLKLDWAWFYKGRKWETDYQPLDDDDNFDGPMIQLGDVKPGDYGCGVISVHVHDNPAHVWFRLSNAMDKENGQNEPELKAEGKDADGTGELDDSIHWIAAPLGCLKKRETDEDDSIRALGDHREQPVDLDEWTTSESEAKTSGRRYCFSKGTLAQAIDGLGGGVNLGRHDKNHTCFYGFCWKIPKGVGNEIQTDSVSFDLDFYAEQYRHNERPKNPWKSEN